jgi:flagellar biosynthesis protein FlhF
MEQRFQTFRAATLDEAYREMRRQLGEEAVVVRTGQVRAAGIRGWFGKPLVELVACAPALESRRALSPVERKYVAQSQVGSDSNVTDTVAYFRQLVSDAQKRMNTPAPAPSPGSSAKALPANTRESVAPVLPFKRPAESAKDDIRREIAQMREMLQVLMAEAPAAGLPPEFVPHYRMLLNRGVTRNLAAVLMAAALQDSDLALLRDPRVFLERLKLEIRKRVRATGGIAIHSGACKVVALTGATGVGKTTNLAKLAAYYAVRERARVALITADTYRVAAPEQLRVYANIIGLPMTIVNDAREMALAIRGYRNHDLVLIDTAGGSQFNMRQIQELKETLAAAQPDEVVLVLSANTQLEELRNVVTNFKCLDPKSVVFSKLDETRRFGVILSLLAESGLPLSYLSIGQNVPDDILLARPSMLANLIVEGREDRGRPSTTPA